MVIDVFCVTEIFNSVLLYHRKMMWLNSKNYFQTGSNGTEKVPFIAEVRERMLQDGVLKNELLKFLCLTIAIWNWDLNANIYFDY